MKADPFLHKYLMDKKAETKLSAISLGAAVPDTKQYFAYFERISGAAKSICISSWHPSLMQQLLLFWISFSEIGISATLVCHFVFHLHSRLVHDYSRTTCMQCDWPPIILPCDLALLFIVCSMVISTALRQPGISVLETLKSYYSRGASCPNLEVTEFEELHICHSFDDHKQNTEDTYITS